MTNLAHLQESLPYDPTGLPHMRRLPGTAPLGGAPWLLQDEAFAGQMRLRDRLLARYRERVIGALPGNGAALDELHGAVLAEVADWPGVEIGAAAVRRPDGVEVARSAPVLEQLARLVQEDLCLLQPRGDSHVLTAATLLFPAHWTLAEKLGRPLPGVHDPVPGYDAAMARRVQRLFDALHPDRPIWRFNLHGQETADLYTPLREDESKPRPQIRPRFVRSERQVLKRLPETGAVVFSIKTYLLDSRRQPDGLMALLTTG